MALGNVFMTDTDGNIGSGLKVSDAEKICGLLFDISAQADFWTKGQGAVAATNLQDTVVELNTLEDAESLGIVAYKGTNDTEGNTEDFLMGIPHYHIKQFFQAAGGEGRLYVCFADCSSNWNALIDMQKAANGMIGQIGVWTEKNLWRQTDGSAEFYALDLVTDLQAVAKNLADDYYAPVSILLSANTAQVATTSSSLDTVTMSKVPSCIKKARYVSVVLGQAVNTTVHAMQAALDSKTPVGVLGVALGLLSGANVGVSIGWVQEFDLSEWVPSAEFGFGDATVVEGAIKNPTRYSAVTRRQLDDLDDKGYIFVRAYEGLEGRTYFNKDTACSDGDYCSISRNRVINKSRRLVRQALLPYVNSPLKVDPATGNLSVAQAAVFTNLVTSVLQMMENAEEISSIGTVNVPTAQNILQTKRLDLSYTIIPLGCAEAIYVKEGLAVSQ